MAKLTKSASGDAKRIAKAAGATTPAGSDAKVAEARKLIDECAAQLRALNGGENIPAAWRSYLLKATAQKAGKAGRKRDLAKFTEVAKALTRARSTRAMSPTLKDNIAEQCGVSRKTVERIAEHLREAFHPDLEPPAGTRGVILEAVAEEIGREIMAELSAEGQRRKRKFRPSK